ncbi:MAG: glutamate dehydrogenase [Chlamydiae bacterium CG10_big_fil_rev_8_21_14_0_10_42_34]|nr:MAG: glutamate dehydrogenase [Chlamydiae bacterium CG10_big_fil_rev_8_21_14_0_10_42_34]
MQPKYPPLSPEELKKALEAETKAFEESYLWLEKHMPPTFLDAVDQQTRVLIARNLLSFNLQDNFTPIHFKHKIIVLSIDAPDSDLKIFKKFRNYVIRYYRTFVSDIALPNDSKCKLRITLLYFYDLSKAEKLPRDKVQELYEKAREHNPKLSQEEVEGIVHRITPNFLTSMAKERLSLALKMFFRAKSREQCQYEVIRNEDWKEQEVPSLQIVMAWKNVPKAGFLFHLAQLIHHHGLALKKVVATYIDISTTESVLILSLGLHGLKGKAAWEEANIQDFLRELALVKYFETDDLIGAQFVDTHMITGNEAHLVRNFVSFTHQVLVYADPNLYSHEHIVEGLCRHPELTVELCKLFALKFDPEKNNLAQYDKLNKKLIGLIEKLDTGQAINDLRRKNILKQVLNFIDHTLKTNFYRNNKSGFSFRLDPKYLDNAPFDRKEKFPELPFGIFFVRGMHFIGFNIRFKDLARGGVRTVIPEKMEQYYQERNNIFSEAYNLAYTQQKKNKDIPEGGAKTAILLEPFEVFAEEAKIYKKEMTADGIDPQIQEEKLKIYHRDHKLNYLYASQSSYIDSFMTLINCEEDGKLRAKSIVDYWKKPEYIYLGPDENMFNKMIDWIANFAVKHNYKPGRSFMSSKPGAGINHKEFGVTSYGVNVYLHEMLHFLGIDPKKDPFTVKISGGPDGDVAGNEILNLYKYYTKTAKLLALTDVSGTIYDPEGLNLQEMAKLFETSQPIRSYPAEQLHEGGFLLDVFTKREESALAQQTLIWRKKEGKVVQEWLSGDEMHQLYRNNVHQVKADVFIPGGGRPRTLNDTNYFNYLDETGKPTSKAIVEGANLYLTPGARHALEKLGVLIFKDSSCNKGGVICSSFEVLASLCMSEEEFVTNKKEYVKEVLQIIAKAAENEAKLLLDTHQKTGQFLTDISDLISEKINLFKYQLLDYLEKNDLTDPALIQCLLQYCPPLLRKQYEKQILAMPDIHKKAVIACFIASHTVYKRGLEWSPTIADILPTIAKEPLD